MPPALPRICNRALGTLSITSFEAAPERGHTCDDRLHRTISHYMAPMIGSALKSIPVRSTFGGVPIAVVHPKRET
jgi:hypothetical protein